MQLSFCFLYNRLPPQINLEMLPMTFIEQLSSRNFGFVVFCLTFCTCIAYNSNKHEVFCPLSTVLRLNYCNSYVLGVA